MYVGGRLFCLTMADADRLDDTIDETAPTETESAVPTSEEQNFDLAKLIFIRVWYVYADQINLI